MISAASAPAVNVTNGALAELSGCGRRETSHVANRRRARSAAEIVGSSRIAVLVPCYNEEAAIGKVVADFRAALPEAGIYVYDNNSTDRTVGGRRRGRRHRPPRAAPGQGPRGAAHVHRHRRRHLRAGRRRRHLRRAERAGDDRQAGAPSGSTWSARSGSIARRRPTGPGHRAGNRLLTGFVAHVFGQSFTDMLSGYRVFTRRFVKSFPVLSGGFEIETELTIHALELELPVGEMRTPYYSRPQGSASKLSTWRDGCPHPADGAAALSRRAAAAAVHRPSASRSASSRSASRSRSSSPICRKASCRGCRPRCCPPG